MNLLARPTTWCRLHARTLQAWSLVVLGLVLYADCLPNKLFWDDNDFFIYNAFVHDWHRIGSYFTACLTAGSGILIDYWRPALLLIWSVAWHLWGAWPPGYHLLSVGFHIANAVLLWRLLGDLFRDRRLAWLTALIFLVHTVQTEAVVNASGLGDPASLFFILAGLVLFLKFRASGRGAARSPAYWLSLLLFVLALMAKETAIILPGLVLLTDLVLARRDGRERGWRRTAGAAVRVLWPYLVLAAVYVLLRATVLDFVDTFNVSRAANVFTADLRVRLLTFFGVFARYLGLLVAPVGLHMERTVPFASSFFEPLVLAGAVLFFGLLALAVAAWRRWPPVSFGLFWFFLGLAPVSNLAVPLNGVMYEHWLYLPLFGPFLALIWAGSRLAARRGWKWPVLAVLTAFILILSVLTVRRNLDWRDPIVFYKQILTYSPNSYRITNNLATEYSQVRDFGDAILTYRRAIALDPQNPLAYHNLGNTYHWRGDDELALDQYRQAIRLDPGNRILYDAPLDLLQNLGRYQETIDLFKDFLPHAQNQAGAYRLLAQIALKGRDLPAALDYLDRAAAAAPDDAGIRRDIEAVRRLMDQTP